MGSIFITSKATNSTISSLPRPVPAANSPVIRGAYVPEDYQQKKKPPSKLKLSTIGCIKYLNDNQREIDQVL